MKITRKLFCYGGLVLMLASFPILAQEGEQQQKLEQTKGEISRLQEENSQLQQQLDEHESTIADYKQQIDDLDQQIEELKSQLNAAGEDNG